MYEKREGYIHRPIDELDGSGPDAGRYDSKEEKKARRRELGLPIVLLVVMVMNLVIFVGIGIQQYHYYSEGEPIEAQQYPSSKGVNSYATFVVDHSQYTVSTGLADCDEDGKVIVYCLDSRYDEAVAIISLKYWIIAYGLIAAVIAGMIFWIYKVVHKTNHATVLIKENYH